MFVRVSKVHQWRRRGNGMVFRRRETSKHTIDVLRTRHVSARTFCGFVARYTPAIPIPHPLVLDENEKQSGGSFGPRPSSLRPLEAEF